MKKNFIKLVCLAAVSLCALSVVGQERMPAIGMGETRVAVERDDVRLRAEGEAQRPDSIVMYGDLGEGGTRVLPTASGAAVYFHDYYECWVDNLTHFTVSTWPERDYDVTYNSLGLVESMTYPENDNYRRTQYQYNANGYILSSNGYIRRAGSTNWELIHEKTHSYDNYGNWLGYQSYYVGGSTPSLNYAYTVRVDDKGRIVYSELRMGDGYVLEVNGQDSKLQYYIWYYSDGRTPNIAPENTTPVGDSNQGSFDLDINIPADSINNGSLVITLPEGFTDRKSVV